MKISMTLDRIDPPCDAVAADERRLAEEVARAVARVDADNAVAWLTGAALRCQGLLDGDARLLCAAADAYADGPRPLQARPRIGGGRHAAGAQG